MSSARAPDKPIVAGRGEQPDGARFPLHARGLRLRPRVLMDKFVPSEILVFLAAPEHSRVHHALPEHGKADTAVIQWQTSDD